MYWLAEIVHGSVQATIFVSHLQSQDSHKQTQHWRWVKHTERAARGPWGVTCWMWRKWSEVYAYWIGITFKDKKYNSKASEV